MPDRHEEESYESESLNDLRRDLLVDRDFRQYYAESFLNTSIAAQIKVLRKQRGLNQDDLASLIGTKQAGVSRIENVNYSSWKTETLRRIARALDVRLKISFESFGSLLDDLEQFGSDSLRRPIPDDDVRLTTEHVPSNAQEHDDSDNRLARTLKRESAYAIPKCRVIDIGDARRKVAASGTRPSPMSVHRLEAKG